MKRYTPLVVSLLLLSLTACELLNPSAGENEPADADLVGPTWKLVSFEDADGTATEGEVDPDFEGNGYYTLIFKEQKPAECFEGNPRDIDANRCIKSRGYPNTGYGTYTIETDSTLSVHIYGATEINPLPGSREQEFFSALSAATSYEIDGRRLTISYGDGKTLHFEVLETDASTPE